MRTLSLLASLMTFFALVASPAAAADQCLSEAEIAQANRMSSIMAVGSEIRHCGSCLGDRYPNAVRAYESGLLSDFFSAKDTFKGQEKINYADDLVRAAARKSAETFSKECDACDKLADTVEGATSPQAREQFYAGWKQSFIDNSGAKVCQ
jgi:hypothetical protein